MQTACDACIDGVFGGLNAFEWLRAYLHDFGLLHVFGDAQTRPFCSPLLSPV